MHVTPEHTYFAGSRRFALCFMLAQAVLSPNVKSGVNKAALSLGAAQAELLFHSSHSFCLAQGTHRPTSRCLEVTDGKCKTEMHVLNERPAVRSTPLWSGCTTFSSLPS